MYVKKAKKKRENMKKTLPDFKTQQLLCYGNVVAKENVLDVPDGSTTSWSWIGREDLGQDVLDSCKGIKNHVFGTK